MITVAGGTRWCRSPQCCCCGKHGFFFGAVDRLEVARRHGPKGVIDFRNALLNDKRKASVAFFCLGMFLGQRFLLGLRRADAALARG